MALPQSATFVFGSWVCVANGLGGFDSHLTNSPTLKITTSEDSNKLAGSDDRHHVASRPRQRDRGKTRRQIEFHLDSDQPQTETYSGWDSSCSTHLWIAQLGGSFGGHLWSCPSRPTSLISRATSRLPCVALASRTAHPVRGTLPWSGRGRPVTLAGVMRWCVDATIITVGEATSVDAPSCSVALPGSLA